MQIGNERDGLVYRKLGERDELPRHEAALRIADSIDTGTDREGFDDGVLSLETSGSTVEIDLYWALRKRFVSDRFKEHAGELIWRRAEASLFQASPATLRMRREKKKRGDGALILGQGDAFEGRAFEKPPRAQSRLGLAPGRFIENLALRLEKDGVHVVPPCAAKLRSVDGDLRKRLGARVSPLVQ